MTKVALKLGANEEDALKEMEEVLQFSMKLANLTEKHLANNLDHLSRLGGSQQINIDVLSRNPTVPPPVLIKVSDLSKEYPEVITKVPLYKEV